MRLYDGCPDKELQAIWDRNREVMAQVREFEPEASCTRFHAPTEGYAVHVWGKFITPILSTALEAKQEALRVLRKGQ